MAIKTLGIIIFIVSLLLFAILTYTHISWIFAESDFPLSPFVYFSLLLTLLSGIVVFRLGSGIVLWTGFLFFLFGGIFTVFALFNISEPLFRFSFVFFLIGFIQSLFEYARSKK